MNLKDVIIDMHQGINTVADKVEYLDEGIPIIQSKNFTKGYLDLEDVRYLGKDDEEKYIEKYNPHVGDILMANIGTIGKSFVITEEEKFLIAWNAFLIKPNHKLVLSEFLKFYFDYLASTRYFDKLLTGGTVKFINKKKIGDIPFPKKDMLEQKEIVKKLSAVENIVIARRNELEKLDELIKARFVEMFGNVQNEEKYPGIPLRELCTTISGGTPSTKFPEYYEGDIPWISTVSLGPNHIDGANAKGYITEEAIKNSATKLIPAGNILFGTRVGVGKSSLNDVDICTNQDIVAIVGIDEEKYSRLFVKHVLDSYQPYFDSIKKGATILGITSDDLKDSLIPQVPLGLQKEYEIFVCQVDKSKVAVQKALDEAQLLFDSLMQKYFG